MQRLGVPSPSWKETTGQNTESSLIQYTGSHTVTPTAVLCSGPVGSQLTKDNISRKKVKSIVYCLYIFLLQSDRNIWGFL